jgi:hypothetical protein
MDSDFRSISFQLIEIVCCGADILLRNITSWRYCADLCDEHHSKGVGYILIGVDAAQVEKESYRSLTGHGLSGRHHPKTESG